MKPRETGVVLTGKSERKEDKIPAATLINEMPRRRDPGGSAGEAELDREYSGVEFG